MENPKGRQVANAQNVVYNNSSPGNTSGQLTYQSGRGLPFSSAASIAKLSLDRRSSHSKRLISFLMHPHRQ